MDVETELWALEEGFWTGGTEFYRHHLAGECLMVFPAPVGILNRDQVLESLAHGPRWARVAMNDRRALRAMDKTIILAYRADGEREDDGSPYAVLAASVYVYRDGTWRLAFHQQTPNL